MKVYLSTSFHERARAKAMADRLRFNGIEIAYDWFTADRPTGTTSDADLTDRQRITFASAELDAIREADVFWLLAPTTQSRGAWFEFGYAAACAHHPSLVVSGPARRDSIFTEIADECFATDLEALIWLVWVARESEAAE